MNWSTPKNLMAKNNLKINHCKGQVRKAGYDCSTVVIVMNTKDYQNVELLHAGKNDHGSAALKVQG